MNWNWLFKMAWRDSRSSFQRLLFFSSAIVFGIMAIVAVDSLRVSINENIEQEAKSLLGADFLITSNLNPEDSVKQFLANSPGEKSTEISFLSMASFSAQQASRLCNVKAIDSKFPFYGDFVTAPADAKTRLKTEAVALIDEVLAIQFNLQVGDSIQLGEEHFTIAGKIVEAPGLSGFTSAFAPVVFIPHRLAENTQLIQRGSRVTYLTYFKAENNNVKKLETYFLERKEMLSAMGLRTQSLEERKQRTGRAFGNLSDFLMLAGFIALLLGCIGIGSAVNVYMKEKISDATLLRCLGCSQQEAISIYIIQILSLGLVSGVFGAFLGVVLHYFVPQWLSGMLPFELETTIVWSSVFKGLASGAVVALVFSFLPLIRLWNVSPLQVLQSFNTSVTASGRRIYVISISASILAFSGLAFLQIGNLSTALFFLLGLLILLLALYGLGVLILFLLKQGKSRFKPLWIRQSISNLSRPNNQTSILITTLGFAGALIFTMLFSKDVLLGQLQLQGGENEPNLILFDIRENQREELNAYTADFGLPIIQEVPIVAMRIQAINGRSVAELKADSTLSIRERTLEREFRVTFRDSLIETEQIVDGEWIGTATNSDFVPISLEERTAQSLGVNIGDTITYNVQGLPMSTIVSSFRTVNFNRIQTNFTTLFPKGVLENAPKFYVIVSRTKSKEQSAAFQNQLVARYPNVSVIDLDLIIKTVKDITTKINYVVQFMALFSVLTGVLVLLSTLINVRFQRIKENILLRTLGAQKKLLVAINLGEFTLLGFSSSLAAVLLAVGITYAINVSLFKSFFSPSLGLLFLCFVSGVAIVVLISVLVNRGIYNRPPLEVLRNENS